MCGVAKTEYPFDPGTHLMLGVIGVSFTVENAVKGAYENTVGRLTERISHRTEEDEFAARTARAYGTFMHTVPWYEFPFATTLGALWRQTPPRGAAPLRKWERRLALSAEYGGKAAYGWIIRRATGAVYAPEDQQIHAWIDHAPDAVFADGRVRRVRVMGPRAHVVLLPRYEAFTTVVTALVRQGVRFVDIAGNDTIVVTAIVPRDWTYRLTDGTVAFEAALLTNPAAKRIVVTAPVQALHVILPGLERHGATIEHLHDY